MKIGKVKKTIDVSANDIEEALVGAFEGGSNYWLLKVRVKDDDYKGGEYASDVVGLGGELILITMEGEKHKLTQAKMVKGFQKYLDNGGMYFPFDCGGADGRTYDTILQNALFGEQVYG
tara:strand:- start:195 stop:551 length:357 start_codon:yes stop_codon:yes gene_type:complete